MLYFYTLQILQMTSTTTEKKMQQEEHAPHIKKNNCKLKLSPYKWTWIFPDLIWTIPRYLGYNGP